MRSGGTEGAALGDLDGVGQRLRQVRKQLGHLLGGLEEVLARQAAALVLRDVGALGDAQQRVVRLVVVGRGEIDLVGGDDRQPSSIGEVEQRGLGLDLVLEAVALDFDIEPVAEDLLQHLQALERHLLLPLAQGLADGSIGAAGQRDQAGAMGFEPLDLDVRRLVLGGIEEGAGRQLHEVLPASLVAGEKGAIAPAGCERG